jgi:WD40 repeat protein
MLTVWNVESGKLVHADDFASGVIWAVAFSSDGSQLASCRKYNDENIASTADVLDVDGFKLAHRVSFFPGFGLGLTFTADGRRLVIGGGECVQNDNGGCHVHGYIWIADVASNEPAKRIETEQSDYFRNLRLTPAGDRVVTATTTSREVLDAAGNSNGTQGIAEVQLRDARTGKLLWRQDAGHYSERGVAMLPDGRQIAVSVSGPSDNRIQIIKIDDALPSSIPVPE